MSAVKTDQSEGIPGAGIPEQAIKEMLTGSTASSLPTPHAFLRTRFLILIICTFPSISEPGTGYSVMHSNAHRS